MIINTRNRVWYKPGDVCVCVYVYIYIYIYIIKLVAWNMRIITKARS